MQKRSAWVADCCRDSDSAVSANSTHRFYTGDAVIPFGFGLSYTTWSYGVVSAPAGRISLDAVRDMLATTKSDGRVFPSSDLLGAADPVIKYAVNVTNTGSVDSDEVVLGFMKPPGAGTGGVPLQTLYGFDRVHVPAGKTVTVELYPSVSAAPTFAVLSAEVSRRCCAAACRVLPGRREGRALRAAGRVQCAPLPPPPPRRHLSRL